MVKNVRFPLVEVSGAPYHMGYQYGRKCQFLIRKLARNFDRILLPAAFREEGRKIAAQAIPFVRQHAPDLYEETRGIADGAGLEMEEVFL